MTAAAPQRLGNFFLRMAEALHKLFVALRLFHRVQVSALNVLNNRDFQNFCVRKITDHHRHRMNLRPLRCTPAPLARNDLVAVCFICKRPNDQRLKHALLSNRRCEAFELCLGKVAARLIRVWHNHFNRKRGYWCRGGCAICFFAQLRICHQST